MSQKIPQVIFKSLLLLSYLFFNTAMAERQFDKQKMDDYLALLSDNNKATLSIEIVEKGKQTYQKQTGFAYYDSSDKKIKADANTQYRVGSITKMFTATLIMQLVEQEKLTLSTTLSTYYPEIKNAQKITIDQMLKHRSGLFNYTDDATFWDYYSQPQSQAEMVKRFVEFEPVFKPGKKYSYSNTNYLLLGYIIEKITGKPYQTVLQTNIIEKLNLKNTHLGAEIDTEKNQAQSFYFSKSDWQIKTEWDMSTAGAAGAIISNPHDLNIFSRALMSGELLSKATSDNMLDQNGYGRGLMRLPFYDRYSYGHYGLVEGFNSALMYFPEDDISLALSVNGLAVNFNNDIVVAVLSIYFGRNFYFPNFDYQVVDVDKNILNELAGDYHFQHAYYPNFKIDTTLFVKDDQLFGRIPASQTETGEVLEFSFVGTGVNSFYSASEGIEITFSKHWSGSLDSDRFRGTQNGDNYNFERVTKIAPSVVVEEAD